MRDWSSLAPDLIRHVSDLLLAPSNIESYLDMQAVCSGWRSAMADSSPHGAADLRFCPRHWVMLQDDGGDDQGRLFVNVSTGRFFRHRIPAVRGHALVGASDGLLVLAEIQSPHRCRVFNPLTGQMLRFAAPIPILGESGTVAVAAGSDPMLLLASSGAVDGRAETAWFADPAGDYFFGRAAGSARHVIAATVAYAGQIYMAYTDGSVSRRVGSSAQHGHDELVIIAAAVTKPADQSTVIEAVFLVESAGDLLLVLRQRYFLGVFKVDVERKALEPVTSIGGRALFLGRRCLSVAADRFPTLEGDCLYFASPLYSQKLSAQSILRFKIGGDWEWLVSSNLLSIASVFLAYCLHLPHVKAQLLMHRST
uniref:Uncharacterized protein n=1 Tax=Avena sativa TaxID=4498 RepID=A0ACD5XG86_AVESA